MSPTGFRVELYAAIRRDARAGLSNRALQRKHRVGYRTVAAALASAWPKTRKPPPKRGSRLDPYLQVIDDSTFLLLMPRRGGVLDLDGSSPLPY